MTINDEENISAKDSDLLVMFSFLFSNKKTKTKINCFKNKQNHICLCYSLCPIIVHYFSSLSERSLSKDILKNFQNLTHLIIYWYFEKKKGGGII